MTFKQFAPESDDNKELFLSEVRTELAALRAENDALKQRVKEMEVLAHVAYSNGREDGAGMDAAPAPNDEMVERMPRAIAGHYGKLFDECPEDEMDKRQKYIEGVWNVNINDPTQDDHLEAARAALAAIQGE